MQNDQIYDLVSFCDFGKCHFLKMSFFEAFVNRKWTSLLLEATELLFTIISNIYFLFLESCFQKRQAKTFKFCFTNTLNFFLRHLTLMKGSSLFFNFTIIRFKKTIIFVIWFSFAEIFQMPKTVSTCLLEHFEGMVLLNFISYIIYTYFGIYYMSLLNSPGTELWA